MAKAYYEISIQYSLSQASSYEALSAADQTFDECCGVDKWVNSGGGFGGRDLCYDYDTMEEALAAVKRIQALKTDIQFDWGLEYFRDTDAPDFNPEEDDESTLLLDKVGKCLWVAPEMMNLMDMKGLPA